MDVIKSGGKTTADVNILPENCLAEGIYDYRDSYNFQAYLTELGVPWYLRNLARFALPIVTITRVTESSDRYLLRPNSSIVGGGPFNAMY